MNLRLTVVGLKSVPPRVQGEGTGRTAESPRNDHLDLQPRNQKTKGRTAVRPYKGDQKTY